MTVLRIYQKGLRNKDYKYNSRRRRYNDKDLFKYKEEKPIVLKSFNIMIKVKIKKL